MKMTLITSPILSQHFLPPEDWVYNAPINTKEMWAVRAAISTWGQFGTDSTILFITDNNTVQSALSTGKSLSKEIMLLLLRHIFWLSVFYHFEYRAIYIHSSDNVLADTTSRFNENNSCYIISKTDVNRYLCYNFVFDIPYRARVAGPSAKEVPEDGICT